MQRPGRETAGISGGRVLVVGAGPGGSVAATLLARAGLTVTVAEASRFPREKVCGECLSALGIATLRRAGLAERLGALGANIFSHAILVDGEGQSVEQPLPAPMWGLTRAKL